jgi:hypothetical protein
LSPFVLGLRLRRLVRLIPGVDSGAVRQGRALLLAILVYVSLDLCLPMLPGAFVFDADASVESIWPSGQDAVTLRFSAPGRRRFTLPRPDFSSVNIEFVPPERPIDACCRPRGAPPEPPPPSEDTD